MPNRLAVAIVIALVSATAGACNVRTSEIFRPAFWQEPEATAEAEAERGFTSLTQGLNDDAERHFAAALEAEPDHVRALMGSAIVHQTRGDAETAEVLYRRVLALDPSPSATLFSLRDMSALPITEVAEANLARLQLPLRRSSRSSRAAGALESEAAAQFADDPDNAVKRFAILQQLRDLQLLSDEDYDRRRSANLGALLPVTAPPPGAGLDRPVPEARQIAGRLRAIGQALQMGAMTPEEHAAERTMILDALLPEAPTRRAHPVAERSAADRGLDRLNSLHAAGWITDAEHERERAAIDAGAEREVEPASRAATIEAAAAGIAPDADPPITARPMPAQATSTGPLALLGGTALTGAHGVHLASFRSRQEAARGWTQIRRAHRELLKPMQPSIVRVDRRDGEAVYYRLFATPLATDAAAETLCKALQERNQHCVPWEFETGDMG